MQQLQNIEAIEKRPWKNADTINMTENERCSLANMIEIMILDYSGRSEITIKSTEVAQMESDKQ